MSIRPEQSGDERAIRALTDAAFRTVPYADGDEGVLIERLRADGDLALSLVAINADEAIIGHIAFSPVTIGPDSCCEPGGWYQLGPVSVMPSGQRVGIGSTLIAAGLDELRRRGGRGVAVVGDPAYYARFGFTRAHELELSDALDPFLQVLVLKGEVPRGRLTLAPAFG